MLFEDKSGQEKRQIIVESVPEGHLLAVIFKGHDGLPTVVCVPNPTGGGADHIIPLPSYVQDAVAVDVDLSDPRWKPFIPQYVPRGTVEHPRMYEFACQALPGSFLPRPGAIGRLLATGWAPAHEAALHDDITIFAALQGNDIDLSYPNCDGDAPLHIATQHHNVKVITELLRLGVDVNSPNKRGDTALHIAVDKGDEAVVNFLLKHGANPNIKNRHGDTALHIAVDKGDEAVVNILLKHGANPNIPNNYGDTALHIAVDKGDEGVVNILLKHGANPNIRNHDGDAATHLAAKGSHTKRILEIFRSCRRADFELLNSRGQTPKAIANEQDRISESLMDVFKDAFIELPSAGGVTPRMPVSGPGGKECQTR